MSASHGYNTMGGIQYDDRGKYKENKKVRKSHIDAANQRAMEMPINWCQCKEYGLSCNGCTESYKCMKTQNEN